jgi:hypothetical protein
MWRVDVNIFRYHKGATIVFHWAEKESANLPSCRFS